MLTIIKKFITKIFNLQILQPIINNITSYLYKYKIFNHILHIKEISNIEYIKIDNIRIKYLINLDNKTFLKETDLLKYILKIKDNLNLQNDEFVRLNIKLFNLNSERFGTFIPITYTLFKDNNNLKKEIHLMYLDIIEVYKRYDIDIISKLEITTLKYTKKDLKKILLQNNKLYKESQATS